MKYRDEIINRIFDEVEEESPDKSTEFLMEMTCQRTWQQYKLRIDHGDVATSLSKRKANPTNESPEK